MGNFARQLSAAQRQYDSMSPDERADGLFENGETGEYIRECCGDEFFERCDSVIVTWLTGPQDSFSEAKLLREIKAVARWYEDECDAEDERRAAWRPEE